MGKVNAIRAATDGAPAPTFNDVHVESPLRRLHVDDVVKLIHAQRASQTVGPRRAPDPGFAKGGGGRTMASGWNASLNEGLGRSMHGGGQGAKPPEAASFLYIFIQKSGQKLRI